MIAEIIVLAVFIAIGVFCVAFYRKKRNQSANKAKCPSCKTPFRASDIVSESLADDGLSNGGRMRKLYVTMRCSSCGTEKKLTIYTEYRHHPTKGSPAYQYFKEVEQREWEQLP